jgi:hypothetical protein
MKVPNFGTRPASAISQSGDAPKDKARTVGVDLPTFDIHIERRRARWLWLVSSHDGRPMMQGNEASRAMAAYFANRAIFLLLSTASIKIG